MLDLSSEYIYGYRVMKNTQQCQSTFFHHTLSIDRPSDSTDGDCIADFDAMWSIETAGKQIATCLFAMFVFSDFPSRSPCVFFIR